MRRSIAPTTFTIHTSSLFDPKRKAILKDVSITVDQETGLITKVFSRDPELPYQAISPPDIDLRGLTVVPGFVDAHTHIFLHSYGETPSINQMRDESFVERTLRATNHCRKALLAGYTTYRDLGTEGLGDADVHFRDAINRGIVPGPRLFVATECIASSGGYEVRIESNNRNLFGSSISQSIPRISDAADGVDGARAAVRRRIGAGADLIKFYADYRKRQLRFPPSAWPGAPPLLHPPGRSAISPERNPNILLWTQEEMDTIVKEAKVSKAPVAAHASTPEALIMAAKAGVTTLEHGQDANEEAFEVMRKHGTIFVPTVAVMATFFDDEKLKEVLAQAKTAFDKGVRLACGGDTGAFPHGENVTELELLVRAGILPAEVLTAATLHGWEACGGELCGRKFGWIEEGVAADLVGLVGNPLEDFSAVRRVDFVMKDAKVWKRDGVAKGFV